LLWLQAEWRYSVIVARLGAFVAFVVGQGLVVVVHQAEYQTVTVVVEVAGEMFVERGVVAVGVEMVVAVEVERKLESQSEVAAKWDLVIALRREMMLEEWEVEFVVLPILDW
jgi:hypothetical protein